MAIRIDVKGVLSWCDTVETRLLFISSRRRGSVTSFRIRTTPVNCPSRFRMGAASKEK